METETNTNQNTCNSEVMAILKSPQNSTSVTKFAGPYIAGLIQESNNTPDTEDQ